MTNDPHNNIIGKCTSHHHQWLGRLRDRCRLESMSSPLAATISIFDSGFTSIIVVNNVLVGCLLRLPTALLLLLSRRVSGDAGDGQGVIEISVLWKLTFSHSQWSWKSGLYYINIVALRPYNYQSRTQRSNRLLKLNLWKLIEILLVHLEWGSIGEGRVRVAIPAPPSLAYLVIINYFLMDDSVLLFKGTNCISSRPPLHRGCCIVNSSCQSQSMGMDRGHGCLYISEPLEKLLLNCVEHATFIDSDGNWIGSCDFVTCAQQIHLSIHMQRRNMQKEGKPPR